MLLERAGFLAALGVNTTIMGRSFLLRGFDQQVAVKFGDNMEVHRVNMVRECVTASGKSEGTVS